MKQSQKKKRRRRRGGDEKEGEEKISSPLKTFLRSHRVL